MYAYVHCVGACVCMCVGGRLRSSTLLLALYENLNETVVLVRITRGFTCIVSSVSYVWLPQQYIVYRKYKQPTFGFFKW